MPLERLLNEQLRRLPATGPEGFEGLIASLLEDLTGLHFYLASSGQQSGRDMSSNRYGGSVIAAECKRYGRDSELDERSLQGEITQASINIQDLDLWVLVISRDVPDQVYSSLSQTALYAGIEFRTISAADGLPSSLETLCAYSPETVVKHLRSRLPEQQLHELRNVLDDIAGHANFTNAITRLKEAFSGSLFGYENWRIAQNQWLTSCFQSKQNSHAAWGQSIAVAGKDVKLIERKSSWENLDQWWRDWSKIREPFVLLGEEGDGKTWSSAGWIFSRLLSDAQSPPVIFLSSRNANSRNPKELLGEPIRRQLRVQSSDSWEKRLDRWLRRAVEKSPALILVLDGINERQSPSWWRELLEQLQDSPWRDQVGLLITCRTDYWKRHFANLRHLTVQSWTLPPYDDTELKNALTNHGLSLKDISADLFPMIRKPRYLDLVVRHKQSVAESGDITRARLIYEDWQDKWQRKTTTPLDDEGFQQLIQDLATRRREGLGWPRLQDISALLPPGSDISATLDELCSSRILNREGTRYKVDEHRLVLGFGLLLSEEVRQAASDGQNILDEVIAGWLEPHRE